MSALRVLPPGCFRAACSSSPLMPLVSSGFINIHLKRPFVSKLLSKLLVNGVQPPPLDSRKRVRGAHTAVHSEAWNGWLFYRV